MPLLQPETQRRNTDLPRVERIGERLYFIDVAGTEWRVYDVAFSPPACEAGRRRAARPPWVLANYWWFVRRDGEERCYRIAPGEARTVTPDVLARQLVQAEHPHGSGSIRRCGGRGSAMTAAAQRSHSPM